ncbi:MAG TPA: T9SS type A sorting domain-containing protein [Puia sp.]|jgi:hypothetical protein|nr:T9SS type A sorting domain-containing protein [Puia sp.]
MKKLYSLTLCGLLLLLAAPSFGQYTAVRPGDWHASVPANSIWLGSEPPSACSGCTITLNVVGGGTINLNKHVVLTGNSQLTVGGAGNTTVLSIGNSGATDSSHANSIVLFNDNTNATISVTGTSSVVVAANTAHAGDYDGVFTASIGMGGDEIFFKSVGFAPLGFDNNTIINNNNPAISTLTGGETMNASGTLPILLSEFGATLNDGAVDLNWVTDLEINSDHFAVLRSSNAGAGWDVIGTVPAHGMSSVSLQYSFVDNKPVQGTAEYRLQMVDKDGKYAYSEVKSIRVGVITSVSVYPNPARDFVNVTLGNTSGFTLIRLYNQGGQLLQEKNVNNAGGAIIPLAVSSYPEGNYIVVVTGSDGSRQSSKVIIAK